MQTNSPSTRWPLYEKRCSEWTKALRKINGEFHRDRFSDALLSWMVMMSAGAGAWVLYATIVGPDRFGGSPWKWLLSLGGAALLGLAAWLGKTRLGVRYRFADGEVSEVSRRGRIRWHEPLLTLQAVTFPWPGRGPQMLVLHWSTHRRTIEPFPSIEGAVGDVLRASRPVPSVLSERTWRCGHCNEPNPENFEVCWQCGIAATERR